MKSTLGLLLVLMMSSGALACDLVSQDGIYDVSPYDSSILSSSVQCTPLVHDFDYGTTHLFQVDLFSDEEQAGDYWGQWGLKGGDSSDPFVTQKIAHSYFGFGVWVPPELLEKQSQMSTDEWLKSHGLLLSLGFGDKQSGEPRMRMDYRWHADYEADVMMHIELPF